MKVTYKTEIKPTAAQIIKIEKIMGICCWIYNRYIALNVRLHKMYQRGLLSEKQMRFMTADDFEHYIDGRIATEKKFFWLKQCDRYTQKIILTNAENAFKKFFLGEAGFPRLKNSDRNAVKLCLKSRKNDVWLVQRHKINVPTLGFIKLKEYGYLPTNTSILKGIISREAGRYYVGITVKGEWQNNKIKKQNAVLVNDINNVEQKLLIDDRIVKIERKIRREKRGLERKYADRKKAKGFSNIKKQKQKIMKLEQKLRFIQRDCRVKFNNIDENKKI